MRGDATWIGWPGAVIPPALEKRVSRRLAKDNLFPVFLSSDEEEDFYGKVCNDTLWPLFHYFSERLRFTPEAWTRYVEVNERYADVILEHCEPEARVWVHDFHLMLVPAMLRRRAPRRVRRQVWAPDSFCWYPRHQNRFRYRDEARAW